MKVIIIIGILFALVVGSKSSIEEDVKMEKMRLKKQRLLINRHLKTLGRK